MSLEKLNEMERAGVAIHVFGPGFLGSYAKNWNITAKKTYEGVELNIAITNPTLEGAIDDIYTRWVKAAIGLPNHSLLQIEHKTLDNEIPF